jgi:D-glycero-D-manno-heptose 1,7-bisphosphate phosphatase
MNAAPALFLDRDGVVNVDHGYVHSADRFEPVPGALDLARRAFGAGFRLIVVTNQSGVARGYYGESDVARLHRHMAGLFAAAGAPLTAALHCPFHAQGTVAAYRRDSFWRKPNPGMLLEAARRFGLDLRRSAMVGDQPTDMAAALAAGVPRRILLTQDGQGATETGGFETERISRFDALAPFAPPPFARAGIESPHFNKETSI